MDQIVSDTKPSERARVQATRDARRNANRFRRMHHHAVRTNDMEATRHFYEDILGMPMIAAHKQGTDPSNGSENPFLHCFFELGDGSSLAFIQFLASSGEKLPRDGADHHIALAVSKASEITYLRTLLDQHGVRSCGMDHGFCFSLYVRDPNGMLLEFTCDTPDEMELTEETAATAHSDFARWSTGDYASNFPQSRAPHRLPASPVDDIMHIIRGA